MTQLTNECVIARYSEDVSWASGLPHVVYNKGPNLAEHGIVVRTLPNVGKEAHTYLHHIVANWDYLADVTLFTQAQIQEYVPANVPIASFFDEAYDFCVPWLVRLKQWDANGDLRFASPVCPFRDQIARGEVRKARTNFVTWFQDYLKGDLTREPSLLYSPGAVFSVRRQLIYARGIEFFNRLLSCVGDARFAEECWFLEQSWLYVFFQPGIRVKTLFKANNPNAVYVR